MYLNRFKELQKKEKIITLSFISFLVVALIVSFIYMINGRKLSEKPSDECFDTESSGSTATEEVSCDKPVIYLYGYNDEEVLVELDFDGELTCTYPESDGRWDVVAEYDGTLFHRGVMYPYLYWEGKLDDADFKFDKGFCISGEDTANFLDEELRLLGLNRRETTDFITYWLPKMQNNAYNIISFQTSNYYNKARLSVSPQPDSIIRVYMAWYASDEPIDIEEQFFAVPERSGKLVVEWGGSEVNSDFTIDEDKENKEEDILDEVEEDLKRESQKQQEKLNEMLLQQQLAASSGHTFTDKNGYSTTFTDSEWKKLLSVWSNTGHAEDMLQFHTIGELQQILDYN